jgi:glycosyltransferase involved in cell wall biosynthesis
MRIAQLAPLFEAVPPKTYGGTERVVSWLTDALTEMGHDVTLFASSDSFTTGRLMPAATRSLRLEKRESEHLAYHCLMMEQVTRMANEFDIVHGHLDYLTFPFLRRLNMPSVHTLHGRLDLPHLRPIFDEYNEMPLVSIATHQRSPQPQANWKSTIYHGLPANLYNFQLKPKGDYLLFLGRICSDKGVDKAIEIAHRYGMKLIIAAKVDPVDEKYYQEKIAPLIESFNVEFVGEANDAQKNELLGNAQAILFPIDWEEPFGLVLIEAMACGTPIIAELVTNGENGFICSDVDGACRALDKLDQIDRRQCRLHFDTRFTSVHMAQNYVRVFEEVLIGRNGQKILYFAGPHGHRPMVSRREVVGPGML